MWGIWTRILGILEEMRWQPCILCQNNNVMLIMRESGIIWFVCIMDTEEMLDDNFDDILASMDDPEDSIPPKKQRTEDGTPSTSSKPEEIGGELMLQVRLDS